MRRGLTLCFAVALGAAVFAQVLPSPPQLVLVDRTGARTPLGTLPLSTYAPRISPDGRRIVYDADGAIWIADVAALASPRRLGPGQYPLWSGDGSQVLFIRDVERRQQMFSMAADGNGVAEKIVD